MTQDQQLNRQESGTPDAPNEGPIRVLLVEDSQADARLLCELLETAYPGQYVVEMAPGLKAAEAAIASLEFQAILLDLSLPDSQGIETVDRLLKVALGIPIVVLTGLDDEDVEAAAIRSGAQDYLRKGRTDAESVAKAIRYAIDRKRAQDAVLKSEEKFAKTFEHAPAPMAISSIEDGTYLDVNDAFLRVSGFSREEAVGRTSTSLGIITPQDRNRIIQMFRERGRIDGEEMILRTKDGREITSLYHGEFIQIGGCDRLLSIIADVTDQKQHQREQEAILAILRLANAPNGVREMVHAITSFLQDWSGCEAVGVRLRDGDDFPYSETRGFPPEFVKAENHLCTVDQAGELLRDSKGNPVLECMCGNVLCGRFDPSKPFFTAHGSFWSNGTTELLASTTEADRQARTRNRCNGEGYESVALIPLRAGETTFGLLQFNDRRRNRFSPDLIATLERIGDSIAIALAQRKAEESLKESEKKYRALFTEMFSGCGLHEILCDSTGRAVDYVTLETNAAFESLLNTSKMEVIGKRASEILPPEELELWLEIFGPVALTGKSTHYEIYSPFLKKHFEGVAYCPEKGKFAVVFVDVTARKQVEEAIRQSQERYRLISKNSDDVIWTLDLVTMRFTFFSPSVRKLLGYSPEEVLRLKAWDVLTPESRAMISSTLPGRLEAFRAGDSSARTWTAEVDKLRKDGSIVHTEVVTTLVGDATGQPVQMIGVTRDITDRRKAQEALRRSEEKFRSLFENAQVGMFRTKLDGSEILDMNQEYLDIFGRTREEMVGQSATINWADPRERDEMVRQIRVHGRVSQMESRMLNKRGEVRNCLASLRLDPEQGILEGSIVDITQRKRAAQYGEMGRKILQTLNESADLEDSIRRVVTTLKAQTGFDAVGIRLQDGEDFPYFAQQGFSKDFLLTENTLMERTADGGVCRGKDGNISLECTCGLVLSGKTDPANPLFTSGGSFWTNDSSVLLNIPTGQDPRLHPRNQCIHLGYASVALVPIRDRDRIVGMIQFNDRRKERFSLDTVVQLEGIASHIGTALMRKKAEQSIRESAERLDLAMRFSKMGAFEWDIVSNKRYWDATVHLLLGTRVETFSGTPEEFFAILHPDDRKSVQDDLDKAMQGRDYQTSYRVVWPDGSIHHIAARGRVHQDEANRPVRMLGVCWDVTDRKRAEEAMRESESKLRAIFECSIDAIGISKAGVHLFANPAYLKMFGYENIEDMAGTAILDSIAPSHRQRVIDNVARRAAGGNVPTSYETRGIKVDGTEFDMDVSVSTYKLHGEIYSVATIRDITERKRAEEERQQLEAQYRQAQKMEAVGRLAAGVAHDFNNQLTVIQGYSGVLLNDRPKIDPLWVPLSQIQQAAKRAYSTTNHLLSFSRKQILEAEVVDLAEFLKEAEKPISRMIGEDIKLIVAAAPECSPVFLDKAQLHQVIMNLVVNARDAMPKGGEIVVRTLSFHVTAASTVEFPEAAPGDYVLLEVADTGTGIDAKTLERVFEPFFTTKGPDKGTGLGLSMVMGFIRQSHGFVGIRSEPGHGTAVRLLLPPAHQVNDSVKKPFLRASKQGSPGKTVLIVEDEEGVRGFVAGVLEQAGYCVLAASGAKEALSLSAEHTGTIDLLISDIVMPYVRGDELARMLKKLRPGLQALLMTGYAQESLHRDEELLHKPFEVEDLLARVRSLTSRRKARRKRMPSDD